MLSPKKSPKKIFHLLNLYNNIYITFFIQTHRQKILPPIPALLSFWFIGYSLQNFLAKRDTVEAASSVSGGYRNSPKVTIECITAPSMGRLVD